MRLPLKVLGDRVLVKPDVLENAPETMETGLVVAKSLAAAVTGADTTTSVSRGTVIAVGRPRHPLHDVAEDLARRLERTPWVDDSDTVRDAAQMLRDLVRRQPCCAIGDDVLLSPDAGQQIAIENETYILMHEDEVLAIVEPELMTHAS